MRDSYQLVVQAHRGISADAFFDVLEISAFTRDELADLLDLSFKTISRYKITTESLPVNWYSKERYSHCQSIGKRWVDKKNSCMLEVSSAIIPEENNFLFNPSHPDFHYVKVDRIEDFLFDPGLK